MVNIWPRRCGRGHFPPPASSGDTWPRHSRSDRSSWQWPRCPVPRPSESDNSDLVYDVSVNWHWLSSSTL